MAAVLSTLLIGVIGVGAASAAPAVTSVTPSTLGQGASNVTVYVNGSGFDGSLGAPVVSVSGTGVTVSNTTINGASQLIATMTVAGSAATGARTVTVKQGPNGVQTASCNCLTIAAAPTISGAPSPGGAPNNTGTTTHVTVSGTNFEAGASLRLQRPSFADIVATSVNVAGGGASIDGLFDLTGQAPARWKVAVINPDGGHVEFGNLTTTGFIVAGNTPTLTNVSPSPRSSGTTTVLTLTGTNFARGAAVTFAPNAGNTAITTSNLTWVSLTSFQVTVTVAAGAAPGPRTVTFTNFDTQPATCTNCFTVSGPPTISSVAPSSRGQGAQDQTLVITGSNFSNSPTAPTVTFSGTGVTLHSPVSFTDSSHLSVHVDVDPSATANARTLTVTNADGGSAATSFTVNPAPVVSSATPVSRGQNAQSQNITVFGSNFVATPDVTVSGTGVTVNSVLFTDSSHLNVNVTVSPTATPGARDVTVVNPDKGIGKGTGVFTVNVGPAITTITPNALARGAVHHAVVINGSGFVATPTVKFFNGVNQDANITVHSVVRKSDSQLTLDVSVASGDITGTRDVLVTNPDAGNVTSAAGFSVVDPPTVTNVSPNSGGQGAVLDLTVTGTNFQTTPTVAFSGTGVDVTNVVRVSATELTVTVHVGSYAAGNFRSITVTNPDGGPVTMNSAFLVLPGPHISSITPTSGASSGTTAISNLAGSGFANNATVELVRNGYSPVPMSSEINTPTKITGSFNLATGGPGGTPVQPGKWSVHIVNPTDNGTDTLVDGFLVDDAPSIISLSPAKGGQGGTIDVHVVGTNFVATPTVALSGSGVSVTNVQFVDSSHLTVTVQIGSFASGDYRNITVTNPDTRHATLNSAFLVIPGPHVTSITPNSASNGGSVSVTNLAGSGFQSNAVVLLERVGFDPVPISNQTTTASKITGSFDLLTGGHNGTRVAPGVWSIHVVNPDDQGTDTLAGGFTVVSAAPTVTGTYSADAGTSTTLHLSGTSFADGAVVTFSGTGVTVGTTTVVSATEVDVDITVAGDATGTRDITVTNADGQAGTASGAFTVTVI